jgi:fructose-bisphosphate aldolase class 1
MVTTTLEGTARALVAPGKGILAADESHATIGRRFEPLGIANTEENRRRYRQMLLTTKGIGEYISGVILFDETIRQAADDGCSFVKVRLPGPAPWPLSFSFARALQAAPLAAWRGDATRVEDGQRAFRHRARCNSAARAGAYSPELERSVR